MSKIEIKKAGKAKTVTAWSYYRLNTYEQCQFQFKLTVLDGIKEPGSAAMDRGAAIHKQGELYLKNEIADVPENYKLLALELEELRDLRAVSELEITFTKDWTKTGWFDADAWCRIKIDALVLDDDTIRIIDFKTGKNRGGYEDQLELYALAALLLYPDVKHISAELWFLDTGEIVGTSHGAYTQAMLPELQKNWEGRVLPMFVDDIWSARPNQFCGFCHFRKGNAGPCTY